MFRIGADPVFVVQTVLQRGTDKRDAFLIAGQGQGSACRYGWNAAFAAGR